MHCCLALLLEGLGLRRGGSHPVMRYVRCFSNSGWTDPWSRVAAGCPDVQRGSALSCERGQSGLHNKTIHLCNEVVFPERKVGQMDGWWSNDRLWKRGRGLRWRGRSFYGRQWCHPAGGLHHSMTSGSKMFANCLLIVTKTILTIRGLIITVMSLVRRIWTNVCILLT